jgi:hypothetical protein
MTRDHDAYPIAIKRVQDNFKTWKNRVLNEALIWSEKLLKGSLSRLADETDFKIWRTALNAAYEETWLSAVFIFS